MKPINPVLGSEPLRISRTSSIDVTSKSWDSVLFQQGKSLLDFDLNVQQRILKEHISQLSRMIVRSGFLTKASTIDPIQTSARIRIPDSRVNFHGSYIRLAQYDATTGAVPLELDVTGWSTNSYFLWVEIWFQEVLPENVQERIDGTTTSTELKSPTVYAFGNATLSTQNGGIAISDPATLTNEIKDPVFGAETTRRIQMRWKIRKATVSQSNYGKGFANVVTNPSTGVTTITTNTDIAAKGGRTETATISPARNFLRGDQRNPPSGSSTNYNSEFNIEADTNLWIAGNGTAEDAIALNTVDGRVYGIPICFVTNVNNVMTITDIRDQVSVIANQQTVSANDGITVGDSTQQGTNFLTFENVTVDNSSSMQIRSGTDLRIITQGSNPIYMDPVRQISNGEAGTPTYSWKNAADTGLYLKSADPDAIGLSVNGADSLTLSTTLAELSLPTNIRSKLGVNLPSGQIPTYGLQVAGGGVAIQEIAKPPAKPTVVGTPSGNLTISYKIVAVDQSNNRSLPSEAETITSSKYNVTISFPKIASAIKYEVYRQAYSTGTGGGFFRVNELTRVSSDVSGEIVSVIDIGYNIDETASEPLRNTTADMTVSGLIYGSSIISTGGMFNNGTGLELKIVTSQGAISATPTILGSGGQGYVTGDIVSVVQGTSTNARVSVTALNGRVTAVSRIAGCDGSGYVNSAVDSELNKCTTVLVNQGIGRYLGSTSHSGIAPGNVNTKYIAGDFLTDPAGSMYIYGNTGWRSIGGSPRAFIPASAFTPDPTKAPSISFSNGMYIYTFSDIDQKLYFSLWTPPNILGNRPAAYSVWGTATPSVYYAQNSSLTTSTDISTAGTQFVSGSTYLAANRSTQIRVGGVNTGTFFGLYIDFNQ